MSKLPAISLDSLSKTYLDTNIFIYFFDRDSSLFNEAKEIFGLIESKKLKVDVSVMIYTEILSYQRLLDSQIEKYTAFFEENDLFNLQDVNIVIAKRASFLRRKYRIKSPDAIILASAIESGAEVFITADSRLRNVEEIEVFVLGE